MALTDHTDRSPERARQDYVKAIYQLGDTAPVSGAALARYLAVSRAAVTKSRRLLEKQGFVRPAAARTDLIELTHRGRDLAAKMLRRHRLIETFLHRSLRVPIDDLHAQAEAIEHVISDDVAERLARFLGNPRLDPHGHPIESLRGTGGVTDRLTLSEAEPGSRVRIESIPDRDASLVRDLMAERVMPGLTAVVAERGDEEVRLRSTRRMHVVPRRAAELILVRIDNAAEHER